MSLEVPVLSIHGLVEGAPSALARVAAELRAPCATLGLFHVTGHGIPEAELDAFERAMRSFFALPAVEKRKLLRSRDNARGYYDEELTKNRPDWKEVFDYGAERAADGPDAAHSDGRNQWPEALPELKPVLLRHHTACERIAKALLRAICASLDLDPGRLDPHFDGSSSFVRLNRYPRCSDPAAPDAGPFPEAGHLGVHHHSDAGAFTLLYQDAVAGLQAWHDDRFELVEPVRGALTVNLGDMLQVWSNDRYRSPVHRVLARADRDRYSAPFFFNPRYDSVCQPLVDAFGNETTRFRPISWAHFRDQRSAGDYADYGAEIQIEDFRIEAPGSESSERGRRRGPWE
jgi:isopenicillin N synthase-like dioxygenase